MNFWYNICSLTGGIMTIKMNSVKSSSISEIGYRYRTMQVKFNNGRVYEFKKVPRVEFDKFCSANSKGQFFNNEVKASYPSMQVM